LKIDFGKKQRWISWWRQIRQRLPGKSCEEV
jgi:hypothetical protein